MQCLHLGEFLTKKIVFYSIWLILYINICEPATVERGLFDPSEIKPKPVQDSAAMSTKDGQRQTQSAPASEGRTAFVATIEAHKNMGNVIFIGGC
jgi:hypothetical protein